MNQEISDRESKGVLHVVSFVLGMIGIVIAFGLTRAPSVLDVWWMLKGVLGGGLLGLFLIGRIAKNAERPAAITGVIVGILSIAWLIISSDFTGELGFLKNSLHPFMTAVIGPLVILFVGIIVSKKKPKKIET